MFIRDEEVNEALKRESLKRTRVTALAGVFAKTLSVLTSHKISVNVVDRADMASPAWSSTKEVWLNLAEIKDDFTARSIASHNGIAFHELGHLRYTPRNGSRLVQLINADEAKSELWQSFNMLEDSRIELLLTGWLPSIKSWLTATMCDYLLADQEAIGRAFPLVYGRKYLPVELRQLASDNFIKPEIQQELADILDVYTSLILTGNDEVTDQAFALIQRFNELLKELPPMPQLGNGEETSVTIRVVNPHGHDNRPTDGYESSTHRPASKNEQSANQKNATRNVIEVVIAPKSSGNADAPKANAPKEVAPKEDAPPPAPADHSFGDIFSEDHYDFQPQNNSESKVAGQEAGQTGTNTQVTDTLNDIFSDAVESLSKEINSIANQLGVTTELHGGNAKLPDRASFNEIRVPDELFNLARGFGIELERLKADFDPSWINGERSGKLNSQRYLMGEDLDTVFDSWEEGREDVTEIEAVILLDRSGSMAGTNADNAYKSMWAIKKALERVEARTTVMTFDSSTDLLYDADEKAGTTIRDAGANGGTNPEHAILVSKRILAESQKPIKILFMITDGSWNTEEGEKAVAQMRDAGVLTCQAFISGYEVDAEYLNGFRHNFELMTSMKSAKDILVLGKELVRVAIARNLTNA